MTLQHPLETYGIDSILVVQLNNALRKAFGDISSTLFFEYQTIDALVEHFIKTQKDSLVALVGLEEQEPDEETPGADELPRPASSSAGIWKVQALPPSSRTGRRPTPPQPSMVQDIAIIGLAGRYPGASNVNEFWRNLKAGPGLHHRDPPGPLGPTAYFDNRKEEARQYLQQMGGLYRRRGRVRSAVLQHLPPRG